MKTIYKYPLQFVDSQRIELPDNAEILTVQIQRGVPCIWAIADPDITVVEMRTFEMFGTGHNLAETVKRKYIGTVQLMNDSLVLHVFERL